MLKKESNGQEDLKRYTTLVTCIINHFYIGTQCAGAAQALPSWAQWLPVEPSRGPNQTGAAQEPATPLPERTAAKKNHAPGGRWGGLSHIVK